MAVPRHSTNARAVTANGAEQLVCLGIPNLDRARVTADRQMWALLLPGDAGDDIRAAGMIAELGHFGRGGAPEIDTAAEAYAEKVGLGPVYEVEVEVVCEIGSIKHLERHLAEGPDLLAWA